MAEPNQTTQEKSPVTSFLPTVDEISAKLCWWIVGALTVIAGALRFWKLDGPSLWGDEINFILRAAAPKTLGGFFHIYKRDFFDPPPAPHLPLAPMLEFFATRFGTGEFVGRFMPALFGTLTIPIVFLLAKRLFDRFTGLIAAALTTLSFFLIYYSRDANYYSQLTFMACAFLAVFWTQFEKALKGESSTWLGLVGVWLCGVAALLTHMTASVFVGSIGIAAAFLVWRERATEKNDGLNLKKFFPLIGAYALALPVAFPFIWHTLHVKNPPVDIPPHRTIDKMLNLPWQFGWGNLTSFMAPAAVVFLVCLGTGTILGLRRGDKRRQTGLLLWLVGFFIFVYVVMGGGKNGYMPHYVILTLVPLLMLAAWGMKILGNWLAERMSRPILTNAFPVAAILLLGLFEIRPLNLLYQMPGKPTNWRGIAAWSSGNLPRSGNHIAYFDWWVNVSQHVPVYYKTPGIACAFTVFVNSADDMIQGHFRESTKATLEKNSDAAYVEAMRLFDVDPRFDEQGGRKWDWPEKYFLHKESFRNDPILELDRLGLCPIGLNYVTMGEVEPIIYYNTAEDALEIHRERFRADPEHEPKIFRRFGDGCDLQRADFIRLLGYQGGVAPELRGSHDLREIHGKATVELHNLSNEPVQAELTLVAFSVGRVSESQGWRPTPLPGTRALRLDPEPVPPDATITIHANGVKVGSVAIPSGFILDFESQQGSELAVEISVATRVAVSAPVSLELPKGRTDIQIEVPEGFAIRTLLDDVIVTEKKAPPKE